jgi:hypothetical protein
MILCGRPGNIFNDPSAPFPAPCPEYSNRYANFQGEQIICIFFYVLCDFRRYERGASPGGIAPEGKERASDYRH